MIDNYECECLNCRKNRDGGGYPKIIWLTNQRLFTSAFFAKNNNEYFNALRELDFLIRLKEERGECLDTY